MALINQANRLPTRKLLAVLVSGAIMGAAQSLLQLFWPDHPFAPYMQYVDIWLQGLVMVAAGYFTRESEQEIVSQMVVQTVVDAECNFGSSDQLPLPLIRNVKE